MSRHSTHGAGKACMRWTKEDCGYLEESWGNKSIDYICKHLQRSRASIFCKASELGLGDSLMATDFVTFNQLLLSIGYSANSGHYLNAWVKNRGCPVKKINIHKRPIYVIKIDDFWKWAYQNMSFLNFAKMEPLALGEEPEWVHAKRERDIRNIHEQRHNRWTPEDDARLRGLISQYRYSYADIARELRRSTSAIETRCKLLGIRARPVPMPNREPSAQWTNQHYQTLADGIRSGMTYFEIAESIGKTELAVRQKVYVMYGTKNRDKVRTMLGSGAWGTNAPSKVIGDIMGKSGHKVEVRDAIASLGSILNLYASILEAKEVPPHEGRAA